ncbi:NAD-dependent epimerase/dehydratase family protein [Nitrosarchaeum sp.]|uniref:NAD-dependent epimerase/dehydratase family protein n=1 Tax=Nitrosarchaeum sp. TaxID=2026886 RepID=UPI00247EC9A0|nr:NAD-dependent epimerase/dehydratase family protein [Nitrosarchaeum sp.]MCV0411891.1 GDP-mannose 4,6-dehydratase [Nitrosarchaeum sp.]
MKILITGGAGFVGSHLVEHLLSKNHEITVITRSHTHNLHKIRRDITIEKINVTNFLKLEHSIIKNKPELIIHLAGNTSHSKSFENPFDDLSSNVRSTLNILEIIRHSLHDCKFILGSTFVVIGKPSHIPVDEKTPCNPTTLYGVNRLSSEYYTTIYHNLYNIDSKIFRITNSFGPREQIIPNKNAINYLIYKAYKGEDITIYNKGKFFRDLVYISDVINGIEKIIQKGKSGELYWISSGKKTWFYQLGQWLEELTHSKISYVPAPTYTKKVDVGNFVVNNSKLRSLGWKPSISVKEGIQNTLDYFKDIKL